MPSPRLTIRTTCAREMSHQPTSTHPGPSATARNVRSRPIPPGPAPNWDLSEFLPPTLCSVGGAGGTSTAGGLSTAEASRC